MRVDRHEITLKIQRIYTNIHEILQLQLVENSYFDPIDSIVGLELQIERASSSEKECWHNINLALNAIMIFK